MSKKFLAVFAVWIMTWVEISLSSHKKSANEYLYKNTFLT